MRSGRVTRWANGERGDFIARPRHSLLGHDLAELRQAYHALGASVAGFEVAELLSSVGHLSNNNLTNAHNCDLGHPRAVSTRLVSVLPTCLKVLGLPCLLRFISRHPSSLPSLMSYPGPTSAFHAVDQIAEIKHVDLAPLLVGIAKSHDREVHAEATCCLRLSRLWRRPPAKRTWELAAVSVPHWRCYLADRMPAA